METSRDDFIIAIRSAFLKKGTQQKFSLLSLLLFSIIFLVLGSLNFKAIDYVKLAIKEIVYTSSFIVSVPENFVKNTYSDISNHFSHYNEYKKIKVELESLKLKKLTNKILTLENIKYKKLVDDYFIKENETFAKVLIDKQSPFLRSIIINKGSKNNIKLGMIVLDEDYLVGKIVEVNYLTSRVLLISDINSKIPVTLQPGDIQAIMSGKADQLGVLQYVKDKDLKNTNEKLLVLTSGFGGVFIGGIPIGEIRSDENSAESKEKIVNFFRDFSQLKYVKIVSYSKDEENIDLSSKAVSKKAEEKIIEINKQQATLKILLEQKKIADEVRIKIEEENTILKNRIVELRNELSVSKDTSKLNKKQIRMIKFNELNTLYGVKCKKNFFNKLYKVGTKEYEDCVLNKGLKK
jgi:rod shape-determining protein MreC